jgi:hypothetical protein
MTSLLDAALEDLLLSVTRDHQRVCAVLTREQAPPPEDPELAALAAELHRLRWMEPEAPAMALLGDAAARHPRAVESHLTWLAANATGPGVLVLADPAPPPYAGLIRLVS